MVQDLVEGRKYDAQSTWPQELLKFDQIHIDVGIIEQDQEHLVVLLLDDEVKWSLALPISDVQVEDLPFRIFIELNDIFDSLVLLLPQGNVDWCGLHLVHQVHVHVRLKTLLQDLVRGDSILVVFDEEQVDDVCANGVETMGINLIMHLQEL